MASGNAKNIRAFENDIFLKVDCVEPVYDGGYSISGSTRLNGIKVWLGDHGYIFPCDCFTICKPDVVREDAYRQAFALMREIYDMTGTERREAFGMAIFGQIVNSATYEDLAKKLDAWKKEKEEIHVKDEVVHKRDATVKFVVTEIHDSERCTADGYHTYISGVSKDGKVHQGVNILNYKKTGVHVDDLNSYVEGWK